MTIHLILSIILHTCSSPWSYLLNIDIWTSERITIKMKTLLVLLFVLCFQREGKFCLFVKLEPVSNSFTFLYIHGALWIPVSRCTLLDGKWVPVQHSLSLSQIRRFSPYFSVALCDCQFPAELNGEWFSVENSIPLRLGISGNFWNEISGPKDSQASYMTCKDIFIHPPRPGQDGTQGNNMTVLMEYHK